MPDPTLVCITMVKRRLYSKENCIGPSSNGLNLCNPGLPEYDFFEVKKNNFDSLVAKRSVR